MIKQASCQALGLRVAIDASVNGGTLTAISAPHKHFERMVHRRAAPPWITDAAARTARVPIG
jgi:hypothetical protein